MRLNALLAGTGYDGPRPEDVEIQGISYDTRTIRPGELFVALRGYKTDGHQYIDRAREKGAAAVVAEEGKNVLLVPDSRAALGVLSQNWFAHPAKELTVVGVTGTNGKTTVTTLLWQMLMGENLGPVGLIGTNENRIGEEVFPAERTTPESWEVQRWLRSMADAGCRYVVMEVSSHALSLGRVAGIPFSVGAFTNLTQDHLDFHRTMEAYREAKGRLFTQCGTAVLNGGDPASEGYRKGAKRALIYAKEANLAGTAVPPPDLIAEKQEFFADHVAFEAAAGGQRAPVRLNIPGSFSVENGLCVLGCALALGIPLKRACAALGEAHGAKGRMEVVPTAGPGTVIIDYAHTPDALKNALEALRQYTTGRLICLFGCGGDRDRGKRPMMGAIAAQLAHVCVVTSDNPRSEDPEWVIQDILRGMSHFDTVRLVEPDRIKAIGLALSLMKEGDTLLLAGKGHETYQEVDGEKRHMDEREIIREWRVESEDRR